MLRIFFPGYVSLIAPPYTDPNAGFKPGSMNQVHSVLEGSVITITDPDYYPHKRLPIAYNHLKIGNPEYGLYYDEYIDLYFASSQGTDAAFIEGVKDAAGVERTHVKTIADLYSQRNRFKVASKTMDFKQHGSYFKSYPIPDPNRPETPEFYATGLLDETTYFALAIVAEDGSGKLSYASQMMVVSLDISTSNVDLVYRLPVGIITVHLYRAPIERVTVGGKRKWRLIDNLRKCSFGANATALPTAFGINTDTQSFCYDTILEWPYIPRAWDSYCLFEPKNDGLIRMGLEWQFRLNSTFNLDDNGKRMLLILNTENNKYYRGMLMDVDECFIEGIDQQDGKNAGFEILVEETGFFIDDALDNPNLSTNFTLYDRNFEDALP